MTTYMKEQPITFFKQKPTEVPASEQLTEDVLPEIALQPEVRERLTELKGSASRWSWMISDAIQADIEPDPEFIAELLINEKKETPRLVSAIMERACNLQCSHCLYQDEKSSASISEENHLGDRILDIVRQMPEKCEVEGKKYAPEFMSCGRILRPWHFEVFERIREERPDVPIGIIDNGSFTTLLSRWPAGFKFDWMDISVDGVEETHNAQRQSSKAYMQAIEGLKQARRVTKEDGRVSSLLTLTNLNAQDIEEVSDILLDVNGEGGPLADFLNVTTVGPTNPTNSALETSVDDFKEAWEQIKRASAKYGTEKIQFSIYRVEDMEKLAEMVGEERFLEFFVAKNDELPQIDRKRVFLTFEIDGVKIQYQPLSLWTPEEYPIEADGAYRAAYEGKFTLEELRSGVSKNTEDTTPYTFEQLTEQTNFQESFERAVDAYWTRFGKKGLKKEMETFKRIRDKVRK